MEKNSKENYLEPNSITDQPSISLSNPPNHRDSLNHLNPQPSVSPSAPVFS